MSYTAFSATATCKIEGFKSAEELALSIYDYLVNHPDETPESLDDDNMDSDDVVNAISSYLKINCIFGYSYLGSKLTISYDTENSDNYASDVFDFLTSHLAMLQSSYFMTVNWNCLDSRTGSSGGTQYLDRKGDIIDIDVILTTHFERINFIEGE